MYPSSSSSPRMLFSAAATMLSVMSMPAFTAALVSPRQSSSTACNNSPDLCDRAYNEVTHMGAHNAAFLRDESTNNSLSGNQYFNATKALDAGLRLLQSQVHSEGGNLHLCHSSCRLLDAGLLEDWLSPINDWMNSNPNEVVTILLVNSDNVDASTMGASFEASGIDQHAYVPENTTATTTSWPTLQELIDADTRLVTFIASIDTDDAFPYLLNEFSYIYETHFEVTGSAGFNCTIDRPSNAGTPSEALANGMMPLMNHFMYARVFNDIMIPAVNSIEDTNSPATDGDATPGALGVHAELCRGEWGVAPTFVLVDFYDEGPAVDTADAMNNVSEPEGRRVAEKRPGDENAAPGGLRLLRGGQIEMGALVAFVAAAVFFY